MLRILTTTLFLAFSLFAADKPANPRVTLETTQGKVVVELWPAIAPKAAENFATHAKNGYYDGILFHRIIKNFMIQGGDPTGTGRGGSSIWNREFEDEFGPNIVFDRPGLLAMANHGSQFFITVRPTPWLNGRHTIFGEVVEGYDVIQKLENVPTGQGDRPVVSQKILKAVVQE